MARATKDPSFLTQCPKADVLIVTVTEIEARTVLDLFKEETGRESKLCPIGNNTYHDLGEVGGAMIYMVQSEMGAGGPGGSTLTIQEAIKALSPSAVVMVGIAFGVNPSKQHIGDILVSQQLLGYELQRVGTGPDGKQIIKLRSDRPHASTRLLSRFQSACYYGWHGQNVEFGTILSGEKLVDNQDFRNQLLQFDSEAIGGEMEGSGLYAAAERDNVDWILVKAICDWADGEKHKNKRQRQEKAARNAASFTIHVLRHVGPITPPYSSVQKDGEGHINIPDTRRSPNRTHHQPMNSDLPKRFEEKLIGRNEELEKVINHISAEHNVLVYGVEGIGKRTLANVAAYEVEARFPDGAKWIHAEEISEERTLETIIDAIARHYDEAWPISEASKQQKIRKFRNFFQKKHTLIVLDAEIDHATLTQIIDNLPASCTILVAGCREFRGCRGVVGIKLNELDREEAGQLFMEITGKKKGVYQGISRGICDSIGGVPREVRLLAYVAQGKNLEEFWREFRPKLISMANELNRGRSRILRWIMQRIVSLFHEQRSTLGSAVLPIVWQELPDPCRTILTVLSFLPGGSSNLALMAISGLSSHELDNALSMLLNLQLVRTSSPRYHLSTPIMNLAKPTLDDQDAYHQRMARYFLAYAQEHRDPTSAEEVDALELEWINLRASLAWCVRTGKWTYVTQYL